MFASAEQEKVPSPTKLTLKKKRKITMQKDLLLDSHFIVNSRQGRVFSVEIQRRKWVFTVEKILVKNCSKIDRIF